MASEKGCRKEKNQNIQVFVRLRPLNQRERDIKSLGVVEVVQNKEVIVRLSQQTSLTKKFTFDRAFGPHAKQVEVYQEVVSPLIEEVLAGYNCTVFAYGQTGTGKTHTMVGENSGDETTWQTDPLAGIIPRALSQLFDELRLTNTEYTVRVSYLELYNEELFDLLASSDDNSKLRIYEDVTRKGSNIVNGLEEITVYNKNEVYKIMAQGQERKRVASTLMNAQSSRSHTVFTIVVHMKENSPEGEELVKIGKLNLVDLAGSENISKAGSDNPAKKERARECVNINQSLLTLGRVITALVERHPHIPYRESKLTRILQESLGGRTKTSIIATISPGHKDLEETMSTLEYAHRAKNIQNKPEVNQKMTKKAILKEYAEEIDKLKRDLQAARDKNGVYLANETYTEMTIKQEEQRKEIQELLLKKRAMEDEKDKMVAVFKDLSTALEKRESELNMTKNKLVNTKTQLVTTANLLVSAREECAEQRHLVERHARDQAALSAQAREILHAADTAAAHAHILHDSVDRRRNVESSNLEVTKSFRDQSRQQRDHLTQHTDEYTHTVTESLDQLHSALEHVNTDNSSVLQEMIQKLERDMQMIQDIAEQLKHHISTNQCELVSRTESHRSSLLATCVASESALRTLLSQCDACARQLCDVAARHTPHDGVHSYVTQWCSGAVSRVSSLQRTCEELSARVKQQAGAIRAHAHRTQQHTNQATDTRAQQLHTALAGLEEARLSWESRLSQQVECLERERADVSGRLRNWADEQRQRIQEHVDTEMAALEDRLSKKLADIETERGMLSALVERQAEQYRALLRDAGEEVATAARDLQATEGVLRDQEDTVDKYQTDIHEEGSAISADMEAVSVGVVRVVDHSYQQLTDAIHDAVKQIQGECDEMLSVGVSNNKQLVCNTERALETLVSDNRQLGDNVVSAIQNNNTTTTLTLQQLATCLATVITNYGSHAQAHGSDVRQIADTTRQHGEQVQQIVNEMRDVEDRCLEKEYNVYQATGSTPLRTEYRYPRALAATSPHDRIIARFRANRQYNRDEDCIVVDSDESHPPSECESSLSEDSAVFAAPSPPSPAPTRATPHTTPHAVLTPHNEHNGIMKSTSEIDIYAIKRQQENGKENANRSVSYKKPSRLPAPSSNKKPLVDRNGLVQ